MITFIVGETGSGKTALATYFLIQKYLDEGRDIHKRSCSLIEEVNKKFGRNFTPPDKVPFYTNYSMRLHVGYKKYYEPYFQNPYYFGVANKDMDTQFMAVGGVGVFDEAQRIYNSRKSATFADFVSYAFEIHRQARFELYLIAQRGKLLDCNIRELGVHVIEVVRMDNEFDAAGNIVRSTWYCREFENWGEAQRYFESGEGEYTETEYEYEGNIFESFDSYEKIEMFLPQQGKDFSYLPHKKPENVSKREAKFYEPGPPKKFRNREPSAQENTNKERKAE